MRTTMRVGTLLVISGLSTAVWSSSQVKNLQRKLERKQAELKAFDLPGERWDEAVQAAKQLQQRIAALLKKSGSITAAGLRDVYVAMQKLKGKGKTVVVDPLVWKVIAGKKLAKPIGYYLTKSGLLVAKPSEGIAGSAKTYDDVSWLLDAIDESFGTGSQQPVVPAFVLKLLRNIGATDFAGEIKVARHTLGMTSETQLTQQIEALKQAIKEARLQS
ncbi:MAG: hypothetical protein M1549_00575 [Candidatus Dependentiae bacterium]|nr:hypothetical protein [Candidatus Dependentiae bacterium]